MSNDDLLKKIKDGVGILTFNRPSKKNALSLEMLAMIHLTLEEWAKDNSVRAVIITGAGESAFSSGFDIKAIPSSANPAVQDLLKNSNPAEQALQTLKNYPYPTIAMLNGDTFGFALNLALCCDMRIGADDIGICMPPAKLGAVYHPDGIKQFIEVLGIAKTREAFFTAKVYKGPEISESRFVHTLLPKDSLLETTFAVAKGISENAPLSLKSMKYIINAIGDKLALEGDQRDLAEKLVDEGYNSQDLKEGQRAFFEKRKPVFLGC